jgi:hypothetical protein
MKGIPYTEAIKSILWLTVISRPDTAYAVRILSQFMQNPGPTHWKAVKRIISDLGHSKDLWLTFGRKGLTMLEGYSDADWVSQPHQHLISSFFFYYGQGVISWSSKEQAIITLLSTEAEYVAEMHASKEGVWLKSFIREVTGINVGALTIKADNQGAIALAKDNKFHMRTKHINLRYHFVREAMADKKIAMEYIPTFENVVDIFTKPLSKAKFSQFVRMLGLAIMKESVWVLRLNYLDSQYMPHLDWSCDVRVHVHLHKLTYSLEGEWWVYTSIISLFYIPYLWFLFITSYLIHSLHNSLLYFNSSPYIYVSTFVPRLRREYLTFI